MMGVAVFDTLVTGGYFGGECVPYLAESIDHNEDYTSWTYKIREGVYFHDGNEVTADDVVYSAELQRNDPLVGLAVKPFYPTEGAFEVLDRYTVRFNLLDSWANFCPTSQLGWVASKAWLEAALEDPTLDQKPVGSGPFRFDSRSEDSVTRFVRNEDFWGWRGLARRSRVRACCRSRHENRSPVGRRSPRSPYRQRREHRDPRELRRDLQPLQPQATRWVDEGFIHVELVHCPIRRHPGPQGTWRMPRRNRTT